MDPVRSVNKVCVKVYRLMHDGSKPTFAGGRRPVRLVGFHLVDYWSSKTPQGSGNSFFGVRPRRIREGRRACVDEKSRPLLVVTFIPPVRLDDKPIRRLPFGSFGVKGLWRSQRFPNQGSLGEGDDLFRWAIPLEVILGLSHVGFGVVEITDKEYVVQSLERRRENISLPFRQDSEGADGAV